MGGMFQILSHIVWDPLVRGCFLARKSGLALGVQPEQRIYLLTGGKCEAVCGESHYLREWI